MALRLLIQKVIVLELLTNMVLQDLWGYCSASVAFKLTRGILRFLYYHCHSSNPDTAIDAAQGDDGQSKVFLTVPDWLELCLIWTTQGLRQMLINSQFKYTNLYIAFRNLVLGKLLADSSSFYEVGSSFIQNYQMMLFRLLYDLFDQNYASDFL